MNQARYTRIQTDQLNFIYQKNKYPNNEELKQISTVTQIDVDKIKAWFYKKRFYSKKKNDNLSCQHKIFEIIS